MRAEFDDLQLRGRAFVRESAQVAGIFHSLSDCKSGKAQIMAIRAFKFAWVSGYFLLATAGCATLPDTDALIARHTEQAARFENARGAVSARKSAAIIAQLKRKSGDIDILDKQIALEQAIVGSPLILGNKVTLLQDGAATYRQCSRQFAMPATISTSSRTSSKTTKPGSSSRISCWSSKPAESRST